MLKIFNSSIIAACIAVVLAICAVFVVKYYAQQKLTLLNHTEKLILEEGNNIRLLKVELAYLTRPQSIKSLMFLVPQLQPIERHQIVVVEIPDSYYDDARYD
ncbi:hypothetical protein MIDIC_470020 [Alphaproteobacteria bacterium]